MFRTTTPRMDQSLILSSAVSFLLLLAICVSGVALADIDQREELLEKQEYRSEIEEVVVTARQPEWRQQNKPEWRSERFELPDTETTPRMEWAPEYTKDERDLYDGVRDRKGEKPEFKIFEFRF